MMDNEHEVQTGNLFSEDTPKMPEGYYSGDKPNLNLPAFVEQHIKSRPYSTNEDYGIDSFSEPINAQREYDIFNMHAYWSKKAHEAIEQYIEHYTQPGDLVLDQFCGSGGTALSALSLGRKAIAIDRSPAATFISNGFCSSTDLPKLNEEYARLMQKVSSPISELYNSNCHICGSKAIIHYQVYSMTFQCLKCLRKTPLARCTPVDNSSNAYYCPYCGDIIKTSQEKTGYQLIET
ncbi:DNA methyltransferase [Dehalococcoides mccartyi]|uniref:DNA methyltransferase n=2 Tax=Dehalococcoides TaxID=61434 RepID=A0AB38ZAD9_9CHLR|nr:DNA methyltransferase [Dehalococcoides mccartyi]WRO07560.1 DNA methyltransferase [Dehalococcoides mccartyi]